MTDEAVHHQSVEARVDKNFLFCAFKYMKRGFACQENSDHKMIPGIFLFRKKLRQPVIRVRYNRRAGVLSPKGLRDSEPRYARQESLRARYDLRELRSLIPIEDKKIAANHIFKFSEKTLLLDLVFINHDPMDNLIACPE
jgi:hypothetical protein